MKWISFQELVMQIGCIIISITNISSCVGICGKFSFNLFYVMVDESKCFPLWHLIL